MIGDMKYRVTIEQAQLTPDGAGGFAESWQAVAADPVVYASIKPDVAGAALKFGGLEEEATCRIILRYRTDIKPGMRLVDENGVIYLVTAATALAGRHFYLDVSASARLAF